MAVAALVGVTSAVVGLYVSYWADVATGATIVLVETVAFLVAFALAPRLGPSAARNRRSI
jgi:ABC-type Mn2+/Zn2+ transport system permease subunit